MTLSPFFAETSIYGIFSLYANNLAYYVETFLFKRSVLLPTKI